MKKFLLLFLLLPSLCFGAIAEVGGGTQRATKGGVSANSTTLAFPGNVTAGSLLIVGGSLWDELVTTTTVTDTLSTSYTVEVCSLTAGSGTRSFIAYGIAPSSGANTVTVNPEGASASFDFAIDEFSGVNATPLDVDGGEATGTSTSPLDTITTNTAGALIVGIVNPGGEVTTYTAGGSYTAIGQNTTTLDGFHLQFQIATTATSYNVDWTLNASRSWTVCDFSFKPSSSRRPVAPMVLQ